MDVLRNYIKNKFDIEESKFLEALKMSPGAEGYIHGSVSEYLFKEFAESMGYNVLRIKEKPEGGDDAKSKEARGDFYIRKNNSNLDEWLVIECKGLKSNSEKRINLTKRKSLLTFLEKYSTERDKKIKSAFKAGKKSYDEKKVDWEKKNINKKFPKFKWNELNPGSFFPDLTGLWESREDIKKWLDNFDERDFNEKAYWDLTAPIRLLQTHMPSSRFDPETSLKKTGPLVTEFNILCIDLFLKTRKHEFVFVNSSQLNHQCKSPNHLQQNYTIDILTAKDGYQRHKLLKPWYNDLELCIQETKPNYRKLDKSQLDGR
jgi:hypothetical protein